MKAISALCSYLAIAASSLLAISYSHATTHTWDNSNVTGAATLDWFTGGSNPLGLWTGSVVPVSSNTNTIRFFDNTTTNLTHAGNPSTQTSNINNGGSAFQLGTLTLSGRASATNNAKLNLTISGDALNFPAATGTINLDALNVDADQLITCNLNSAIQLGTASSGAVLTITGNGTSAFNIGGIISELQTGGGSLIKSGNSTVSLTGANSYTGTTTLNGGTLVLNDANVSIASSTGITLNGGNLTLTNAVGQSLVDRVSNSAVITSNGGTITWTNPSLDNTANWAETLGALSLTTGQTNIVSTNAVDAARTQVLTLGAGSLTHAASNTSAITFSGASLGTGTVNNIVITSLGDTAANEIIGPWATYGTSAAAQTDYATYNITGGVTNSRGIQGAGIAASTQSTWSTDYTIGTGALNNTLTNTSGSAVNGRLTATRNINTLRNTTASTNVTATNGTDVINLTGHGFVAGDVVVLGGTTAPSGLSLGVPYYVTGTPAENTFQISTTSTGSAALFTNDGSGIHITGGITLSTDTNLGTYGILNGSTAVLAIGASGTGAVTLPSAASGELYVTPGAGAINIAAPIADNGTDVLTLVKSGNHTLTLSGANTYSGATVVNAGALTISGTGSLGSGGTYAGNISIASNAVLNFTNPVSQTLSGDIANNGTLNFSGPAAQTATVYTVSGDISGSGSVICNCQTANKSITLTLSGNNAYTGTTSFGGNQIGANVTLSVSSFDYITSGTYANHGLGSSLGAPTTVANGTITIGVPGNGNNSNPATLKYTGPGETTDRVLTFAFSQRERILDASGGGLLKFTSPFTFTSKNGSTFPSLTLAGTGLGEVAAGITDLYAGLPVTKTGTGTWTLSANNTYTGLTTVSVGTLIAGSNAPSGAAGAFGNAISEISLGVAGGNSDASLLIGGAFNVGRIVRLGTSDVTDAGTRVLTLGGNTAHNTEFSGNIFLGTASRAGRGVTLTAANGGQVTFSGVIQEPGSMDATTYTVTKAGLGTVVLSNANTYTGETTVSGGTLVITGATQATSAITFGGGVLGLNTASSVTAANATVDFTGQQVLVTGATGSPSYTLLTASSITGTPALAAGSVSGYTLQVFGGNELRLVQTGGGSPYDTWATTKGLTGLPGSSTDPAKDADPDKDGRNNLAEFAFNGNPTSGSDNGKVYVLTEDSDFVSDPSSAKELILTVAVRTGTLAFAGSPSPSANQASDGITYSIEGSLDLASFPATVNGVSPVITGLPADPGAGYEYRSFSLNGSNGLTGKGFLRAKVTSP